MVLNLLKQDRVFRLSEMINGYEIRRILGEGRFGICYQVTCGQKQFILKQLKRKMLEKSKDKVHFEEEILLELEHQAIPRFIEKIELPGFCGYVLEFKEGRTFEDMIYIDRHEFTRDEIYSVGSQLIEILKHLHSRGVVHRDIRVPNTLYHDQKVFLVDFGLARRINYKRYRADVDFAFLGDFLLHLYYSSYELKKCKKQPWYKELELTCGEQLFLKRLMGVEQRYGSIEEVEKEFRSLYTE